MATFSSWLMDQRSREDQVGWVARYWKDLADKPRMSSPVSIEGHLRQRGLLDSQEGLAEAWEVVMTEYRQQRLVAAAADAGVTTEQLAASIERHPSGSQLVQDPLPGLADAEPVPVTLELLDAKLDAVLGVLGALTTAMGITVATGTITAQRIATGTIVTPLEPIDWPAIWEQAKIDAAAGE